MVSVGAGAATLVLILGHYFVRSEALERRLRKIQPDDSSERPLQSLEFHLPPQRRAPMHAGDAAATARSDRSLRWKESYY
jgi:hypothetical protein